MIFIEILKKSKCIIFKAIVFSQALSQNLQIFKILFEEVESKNKYFGYMYLFIFIEYIEIGF